MKVGQRFGIGQGMGDGILPELLQLWPLLLQIIKRNTIKLPEIHLGPWRGNLQWQLVVGGQTLGNCAAALAR